MRTIVGSVANVMEEPKRPNFNLVDFESFMAMEPDKEDVLEGVMEKALKEIEATKNVATKKKIAYWIDKVEGEAKKLGLKIKSIVDLDPKSLNTVLTSYTLSMKRIDGSDFEVASVHCLFSCVGKYLTDNNYCASIDSDPAFKSFREAKLTKVKKLKAAGKGNRPNRTLPISLAEEEKMWASGQLGSHEPMALTQAVWYTLSMSFGLRGRHEARQMMWGDVALKVDSDGKEYLEFSERLTKTRTGAEGTGTRAFSPKAFPGDDQEKCPVHLYKEYARRRPSTFCKPDSPFFLSVNHKRKEGSDIWFSAAPLGKNTLGNLMKTGCEAAGIPGRHTNHSVRKTSVKRMLDAGCPAEYAAQLTGHKNVASLRGYAEACEDVQRKMARSALTGAAFNVASTSTSSCTNNAPTGVACDAVGAQFNFHGCSTITINNYTR